MAVVDAFFSLPRGGAEIGGVLLGAWDGQRLAVTGYAALDCEHAFGPSFTLSPRDEARLADLLAAPRTGGLRPVGWYHSHTRSEIFLSDADLEIHRRFFPEPWQVALVVKPHTFQPTRAGFFFRDGAGMHGASSYKEFVLTPLMVQPAPSGPPPIAGRIEPVAPAAPEPALEPVPGPAPFGHSSPQKTAQPDPPAAPLPKFLEQPPTRSRRWLKLAAALLVLAALGAAGYAMRVLWLPPALAMWQRHTTAAVSPAPPSVGLNTLDTGGQLQIHWNRDSPAVQQAASGVLRIEGGPSAEEMPLDKPHLLSGAFTFQRQSERVDVSLQLNQADGRVSREVTTFVGKLPERKPVEDAAAQEQRESLSKQVAKMRSDLNAEIAGNAKLRKTVDQLSKQLRDQQRSRLLNQAPEKK
jgi:proteasome lid subunit RPN8/RPN11